MTATLEQIRADYFDFDALVTATHFELSEVNTHDVDLTGLEDVVAEIVRDFMYSIRVTRLGDGQRYLSAGDDDVQMFVYYAAREVLLSKDSLEIMLASNLNEYRASSHLLAGYGIAMLPSDVDDARGDLLRWFLWNESDRPTGELADFAIGYGIGLRERLSRAS